jgi:thioredoxin 1
MPDFDSLSDEYRGRLAFAKLNADESPDIASRFGVQGLPTLKFFCAGRPIAEIVGYLPRNILKTQLDAMLSMHKDCLNQSSPMR